MIRIHIYQYSFGHNKVKDTPRRITKHDFLFQGHKA